MHAAVARCGGFGAKIKFYDVASSALDNRAQYACSLGSISLFLCRLAVLGLLHKCDSEGYTVIFSFFRVDN